MRTRIWALAIAAIVLTGSAMAVPSSGDQRLPSQDRCGGKHYDATTFRAFSARVWRRDRWERGRPKDAAVRRMKRMRQCAVGPGNRAAMKRTWRRGKRRYERHRSYCRSGPVFAGRVSEFSGGATADGVHVATEPGIALRSEGTLGETFRLKTAAGTDYVTQIDWGPASFTGRAIDITSAEMSKMGWVPTDSWGEAKLIPGGCIG